MPVQPVELNQQRTHERADRSQHARPATASCRALLCTRVPPPRLATVPAIPGGFTPSLSTGQAARACAHNLEVSAASTTIGPDPPMIARSSSIAWARAMQALCSASGM
eukprot:CAMPEP_0180035382 /NCGR_PEP_ID=MMETSP0984-20121128/30231_1 /TAXON_ID=483367 /ORGANISM="non described non described, Strain CCMP 2436" /LENGTH=107 /DNA_ID=CAMNT_0021961221 /DNA_START=241 /DNA_END=564 /DNA_ORIENTATION=+